MWYEASGHPLLFGLEIASPGLDAHFDAEFVFATRHVDDATPSPSDAVNSGSQPANNSNGRSTAVPSARHRNSTLSVQNRIPVQTRPPPQTTQESSQAPVSHTSTPNRGRNMSPRRPYPLPAAGAVRVESVPSHVSETPNDEMAIDIPEPEVSSSPKRTPLRKPHGTMSESPSPDPKQQLTANGSHKNLAQDESVPETPNPQHQASHLQWSKEGSPSAPGGLLAEMRESSDDEDEFVEGTPPPS